MKINADAFSGYLSHLQAVRSNLGSAHEKAASQAASVVHRRVCDAASDAGIDSTPIRVEGHHVTIDHSSGGNDVADKEFGTPGVEPNPVLRSAVSAAKPEANKVYIQSLVAGALP